MRSTGRDARSDPRVRGTAAVAHDRSDRTGWRRAAALVAVFQFVGMEVSIDRRSRITRNVAGVNQSSTHGKGGGLYILRGDQIDVRPLVVGIPNYVAVVSDNVAHATPASRTDTFHQIYLVDLATGTTVTDGNVRARLAGGNFRYQSG